MSDEKTTLPGLPTEDPDPELPPDTLYADSGPVIPGRTFAAIRSLYGYPIGIERIESDE